MCIENCKHHVAQCSETGIFWKSYCLNCNFNCIDEKLLQIGQNEIPNRMSEKKIYTEKNCWVKFSTKVKKKKLFEKFTKKIYFNSSFISDKYPMISFLNKL